jgi:hypothetical protein
MNKPATFPQNLGLSAGVIAGWTLRCSRSTGPIPESIVLPALLGSRFKFSDVRGAEIKRQGDAILVAPQAANWLATWRA